MPRCWIGTSGYAYPDWRGTLYPADLPEARELAAYARRFPTVELNVTFHRLPNARLLHTWARETPETFFFALKAPRYITHEACQVDVGEAVSEFCSALRPLGQRLGPVLFQLPPHQKRDLPRLEDFLHQLPPGGRYAVEFLHPSWFADRVFDTLRRFGVAVCVAEREELTTPVVATAQFAYLRLRRHAYSEEDLERWRERLLDLEPACGDCFVYFKLPAAAQTLDAATRFVSVLAREEASGAACLGQR
jgi:uncharacterized protein YecE (DUF72 family)